MQSIDFFVTISVETLIENISLEGNACPTAKHGTDVHHKLVQLVSLNVKIGILFRESSYRLCLAWECSQSLVEVFFQLYQITSTIVG